MEILSPRGRAVQAEPITPADRLADLRGKTIGLLDNGKPNADVFLQHLAGLLQEQYGADAVVHLRKPAISKPAPDAVIAEIVARADFVLAAIGD